MSNKHYIIGIIGGIGSGKSAVTEILRSLGATVIVADEINSELLNDSAYISEIAEVFPAAVKGGTVDRRTLSNIVFNDEQKRQKLIKLSHPKILSTMRERTPVGLCFYEIPLINEIDINFDGLWYIYAEKEQRIKRIIKRSGLSRVTVEKIMATQGEINKNAEMLTTIDNNGTLSQLKTKVGELYCALLQELRL